MPIAFYMDENVDQAITRGLRRRGVDVLRAQDDGHAQTDDEAVLDRAGQLGRVVFSQDEDFAAIATRRQASGEGFRGVVYAAQSGPTIGRCIRDLEIIALASDPVEWLDRLLYLPL